MKPVLLLIFSLCMSAQANASEVEAIKGDYQAQRNLAYSYTRNNPRLACAWYRVILLSNSPKINIGDYSNEWTYCHALRVGDSGEAWEKARSILNQITNNSSKRS